jgi:hypothetical protein
MRRGLGAGQGKGYKNIIGIDPLIHKQSALGMKQPQRSMTWQQHERQDDRHREHGRYAKMNPCEICGKSAGANYCSFEDTNSTGYGLVICDRCARKYHKLGIDTSVEARKAGLFNNTLPEVIKNPKEFSVVAMKYLGDGKWAVIYDNKDGKLGIDSGGNRWVVSIEPSGKHLSVKSLGVAKQALQKMDWDWKDDAEPMEHDDGVFDVFMHDVDYATATKEASYDEVDGQVQKQHGTSTRAVFGTVVDEFKAKTINTIHNHPSENPPSMNDIFSFLYSGRHHEDRVVLPSGRVYIMRRKPQTEQLSSIHRQITAEQGSDPRYINALNHDKRSAQQRFARFYNDLTRSEVLKLQSEGLDAKTIRFQKSPEIQDKVLRRLAKHYDFEVSVESIQK